MSDENEQKWLRSGRLEDEVLYLRTISLQGHLPLERIALAAALGDRAALSITEPIELPEEFTKKVEACARTLGSKERQYVAMHCAERALGVFESAFPGYEAPRKLIASVRGYLNGTCSYEELRIALARIIREF